MIEKVVVPGRWFSVAVGLGALGLGIAIWVDPTLAAGFHAPAVMGEM